jgi:hypothetical protein
MSTLDVTVTLKGPLFSSNLINRNRRALQEEVIRKVGERMNRRGQRGSGGKGLGVERNVVTQEQRSELELLVESTRRWPRTKGTSWQRKNIGIVKSMAPRVLRKAALRIAEGK